MNMRDLLPVNVNVIRMKSGNRMVRMGFGQNENRWFFRVDMWWFGIRITGF